MDCGDFVRSTILALQCKKKLNSEAGGACTMAKYSQNQVHDNMCNFLSLLFSFLNSPERVFKFCITPPGTFLNPPQHPLYCIYFPTEKDCLRDPTQGSFLKEKRKCLLKSDKPESKRVFKEKKKRAVFNQLEFSPLDCFLCGRNTKEMRPKLNVLTSKTQFARTSY